MKKIVLINGALGHMGQAVLAALKAADGDLVPAVGIDLQTGDFPGVLFASAEAVDVPFDIAIDFSRPQATMAVLELCRSSIIRLAGGMGDCTVTCTGEMGDDWKEEV